MNLETRAREAAESLRNTTLVDAEAGLQRLRRTQQRRTAGKVVAVLALVATGAGLVQFRDGNDDAAPTDRYDGPPVLISASGGDWEEAVTGDDALSYPGFVDADPVTERFLVQDLFWSREWNVYSPGSRTPVGVYPCPGRCSGWAILGPGADEITVLTINAEKLVVLGPGGTVRRELPQLMAPDLGQDWPVNWEMAWSPDGETLAVASSTQQSGEASAWVVLWDEESGEQSTVYSVSETAPPTFSEDADGSGWGSPSVLALAWSRDSERLAFLTSSLAESTDEEYVYDRRLFVVDADSGETNEGAKLDTCAGSSTYFDYGCFESVWLAWAPDGESLSALRRADSPNRRSTLTTLDSDGERIESKASSLHGPLVWLGSE